VVDDAALMAAVATGNERAVADLHARLAGQARLVAVRIVGEAGADDVVQETFERVWRHAPRFDPRRGTLDAWVLRIARNAAIAHVRRRREYAGLARIEPADPGIGPAEAVERGEVSASVRRAVALLPAPRRAAVEEVLAGHTLIESADRLGIPEGTLKSRVRAAYSDLRVRLAPVWAA